MVVNKNVAAEKHANLNVEACHRYNQGLATAIDG